MINELAIARKKSELREKKDSIAKCKVTQN